MSRSRAWCFTTNNYTEDDVSRLKDLSAKYKVFGYEVGQSGTPHLQGYVEFEHGMTHKSVCKKIPNSFVESRKGTPLQASTYCKKGEKFEESGEISKQGARNDIASAVQLAGSGASFEEIMDQSTSYQSIKIAQLALPYKEPKRTTKPYVSWYWGVSGAGKTHTANTNHPDLRVHIQDGNTKWWEGYDRHQVVIIDDFRESMMNFTRLLRLLDKYPVVVENKGGSRQFVPDYIYITAPIHPGVMYKDSSENLDQLFRRLDEVREFDTKYVAPEVYVNADQKDNSSSPLSEEERSLSCDEEIRASNDA